MTQNDILTLAKAGFTAQQIAALNQVQNTEVQPTPQSNMPVQPAAQSNPLTDIQTQISQLSGMIQAGAIAGAQQPKKETTDDILASIIMPSDPSTGGANA